MDVDPTPGFGAGRPCPGGIRRSPDAAPPPAASPPLTAPSPRPPTSHRRAARALAIVSRVVKVLDATMNSVRAGSSPARVEVRCAPSRLETKCTRGPPACGASARQTIRGPRSDPPMPMFTTSVIRSPVWPRHSPERTAPEKRAIASSPRSTSARMASSTSQTGVSRESRSSACSTARSSVVLMRAPKNIARARSTTPASAARARSRRIVSPVTRFLE